MIQKVSKHQLSDEALEMVAARFKALSERTRLKLIIALEDGEKNVGELVKVVGANQANISHQLQILADAGIVARRKDGVNVYYRISDQSIFELCELVCGSLKRQIEKTSSASRLFAQMQ